VKVPPTVKVFAVIVAVAVDSRPGPVDHPGLVDPNRVVDLRRMRKMVEQILPGFPVGFRAETGRRFSAGAGHLGFEARKLQIAPARTDLRTHRRPRDGHEGVKGEAHVGRAGREPARRVKGRNERKSVLNPGMARRQPEAEQTAVGGWQADRAARVRADRKRHDPGSDNRGRSAARSAGRPPGISRVLTVAVMGILPRQPVGELVHVGLARQDRAGGSQGGHAGAVARRRRAHLREKSRSREHRFAGDRVHVLQEIGYPAERPRAIGGGKGRCKRLLSAKRGDRRAALARHQRQAHPAMQFARRLVRGLLPPVGECEGIELRG